jgi:Lysine-specific metallo-endopeptidase
MFQVFQRPGGLWGYAIFEPDPLNQEISAFTSFGGFFSGGQLRVERGVKLRLDAVYICRRFVPRPLDFQALVIVHELAHFVGFPEQIDDFAYNEDQNGANLGQLSPELRILNADSYANYAFEACTGNEPLSFPP